MSFSRQLAQFRKKVERRATFVQRNVGSEALRRLVLKTPVGDPKFWKNPPPPGYTGGHARANWQTAIGQIPSGIVSGTDKSGAETVSRGMAVISNIRLGQVIFIVNNLPYIEKLEFGWSRQAPNGMVRVTVEEFQGIVRSVVSEAQRVN